jgi:predicted oxidoreductase
VTGLPWAWGATDDEVARRYPADDVVDGRPMTRAVPVAASVPVLWRWLCQVAVAPYSYDWIDNRGRRSPRELTPGADRLELGQTMAVVFRLASYEQGHHWTAVTGERGRRLFGTTSMTYAAEPDGVDRSRLVCRLVTSWPRPASDTLAWGDLVMMRKQLLTLKSLAEGTA